MKNTCHMFTTLASAYFLPLFAAKNLMDKEADFSSQLKHARIYTHTHTKTHKTSTCSQRQLPLLVLSPLKTREELLRSPLLPLGVPLPLVLPEADFHFQFSKSFPLVREG